MNHVVVWQKPKQRYKAIFLQKFLPKNFFLIHKKENVAIVLGYSEWMSEFLTKRNLNNCGKRESKVDCKM